jgi:predicted aspartyl protease
MTGSTTKITIFSDPKTAFVIGGEGDLAFPGESDVHCIRTVTLHSFPGVSMTDSMGTFRIDIELENPAHRGPRVRVAGLLVDTGSELSWVPAPILESLLVERVKTKHFRQASGTVIERWTGEARVHAAGTVTPDEVVFGEPGDLAILGSRTLEGLNLMVDPVGKRLVDSGPAPAAAA